MDILKKLGFSQICWADDHLIVLDQRKLPLSEEYVHIKTVGQAVDAIRNLTVRGAPLIGIAAAYALCLPDALLNPNAFVESCRKLKSARPTATNLSWAVDRMAEAYSANSGNPELGLTLIKEALKIHDEDASMCERIGFHGNTLIPEKCRILTHCNTGALATGGIGTALGVIYTAYFSGKKLEVWVDETRPVLQGARLTAWELSRAGIPHTLITDSMSGKLMYDKRIDLVIVGADKIAENFDFANKIGTYDLAVLAKHHNIPFYCAAPFSTFDRKCPDGGSIEIENRDADEIRKISGRLITPSTTMAYNPAFDVTPRELITGIITEKGLIYPNKPSREL